MSADTDRKALAEALAKVRPRHEFSKWTKRQRFVDISLENSDIVDDLLKQVKKHTAKRQYAEANQLLGIAQRILDNNKKLQNMVGEVLSDVD